MKFLLTGISFKHFISWRLILIVSIFFLIGCNKPNHLIISSVPEGADIIDTQSGKIVAKTPSTIHLDKGSNKKYLLELEGYKHQEFSIELNESDKTISKNIILEKNLNFQLKSTPDGADVKINDTPSGKTPLSTELKPGEHTIIVSKPEFTTETIKLTVHYREELINKEVKLYNLKEIEEKKHKEEEEKRKVEEETPLEVQKEGIIYHILKGYGDLLIPVALLGSEDQEKREQKLYWGPYEGEISWTEGQQKCSAKGMRLPTRREINMGISAKLTKLKEPCCDYWSADGHPDSEDVKYYVSVKKGEAAVNPQSYTYHVRCVVLRWVRVPIKKE